MPLKEDFRNRLGPKNVDARKTVKRAEELGFAHSWFYDSQLLLSDGFVSKALATERTSKIKPDRRDRAQ
jgi:hypothetical protein